MAEQEFTTEELESENWRTCPLGNGRYSVSSLGRIRSEAHNQRPNRQPVIVRPRLRKGYYVVNINFGGHKNRRTLPVHTLVALAFIGPRPSGYEINHMDGRRTNNRLHNLEYTTPSENMQHAFRTGLCKRPLLAGAKRKLSPAQIALIRSACAAGESYASAGRRFSVTDRTVSSVCRHLGAYMKD